MRIENFIAAITYAPEYKHQGFYNRLFASYALEIPG